MLCQETGLQKEFHGRIEMNDGILGVIIEFIDGAGDEIHGVFDEPLQQHSRCHRTVIGHLKQLGDLLSELGGDSKFTLKFAIYFLLSELNLHSEPVNEESTHSIWGRANQKNSGNDVRGNTSIFFRTFCRGSHAMNYSVSEFRVWT